MIAFLEERLVDYALGKSVSPQCFVMRFQSVPEEESAMKEIHFPSVDEVEATTTESLKKVACDVCSGVLIGEGSLLKEIKFSSNFVAMYHNVHGSRVIQLPHLVNT